MIERSDEQDGVDLDRILERVHERTDGLAPGGLTRRRRARAGAWSVAGVGAVAAAGLVVSGVLTPDDDGAAPEAAPPAATASADASGSVTPSATPPPDTVGEAVVYVKEARTAVTQLDLRNMVVSTRKTIGVKHPGDAKIDSTTDQDVTAGDGSGSHWTQLKDFDQQVGPSSVGDQEVKGYARGAKPGDPMMHWYISPRSGAYAVVPLPRAGKSELPRELSEEVAQLRNVLTTVQGMMARDDVVSSAPRETTIDGRRAVCVRSSGDASTARGWNAQYSDGDVDRVIADDRAFMAKLSSKDRKRLSEGRPLDWKSRTCFDAETRLPVLHTFADHYQLSQFKKPSYEVWTYEYAWLPKGPASDRLLAPDLHGLRKVSFKELGRLDSQ